MLCFSRKGSYANGPSFSRPTASSAQKSAQPAAGGAGEAENSGGGGGSHRRHSVYSATPPGTPRQRRHSLHSAMLPATPPGRSRDGGGGGGGGWSTPPGRSGDGGGGGGGGWSRPTSPTAVNHNDGARPSQAGAHQHPLRHRCSLLFSQRSILFILCWPIAHKRVHPCQHHVAVVVAVLNLIP